MKNRILDSELENASGILTRNREKQLASGRKQTRVVLTSRDLDVFKFILEMRYATHAELFNRFFKVTHAGAEATSPEFMRRRLIALESSGLLARAKTIFVQEKCYLANERTRKILQDRNPEEYFPRPTTHVHEVNFFHDQMVLKARKEFERDLGITDWISDHSLKSLAPKLFGLQSKYSPDGVYRLPDGKRVAFEFENAKKNRRLYFEKIQKLKSAMDYGSDNSNMFSSVHFRCVSQAVFNMIKEETQRYGDRFRVELALARKI
ncbi:hypothetical protein BH10BDE1_BH10BDE1_03370 [soil metagenome]